MSVAQRKLERKWSVVEKQGSYVAQVTEANGSARMEGWRVVGTNLTISEACEWRDSLSVATKTQSPDLSAIFTYDHSAELEKRGMDGIQEYDVISAQCFDGIYRTGSVVRWNAETVIMEIGTVLWAAYVTTAGLVCKVDDANYGDDEPESWEVEFTEWLDELDNSYEISTLAGMVA
jgi:hypothetical protein